MGGVPVLRGNLSSGDFGEPLGPACIGARGLLLMGAAGGDRVPGGFQREPGLSWASQPAAAATTTTARPEWGSPVFASVCAFARSLEAAGWGDPSAALVPAAPAARNSCFLFEKQAKAKKKKKRLSNLFGERSDAQRTRPLPHSLLLSEPPCGLGENQPGESTPTRRSRLGGGAASLLSPTVAAA